MDTEKFGKFIAACRMDNHMTQKELAQKLQVTDKAVSRWERGKAVSYTHLRDMEKQIMKAADQAAAHPEDERLLHRLDSLQQEYDRKGGYTYKSEMNGILTSMAFGPEYQMCIRDRSLPMPKDFFRSSVIMTSPPD